MLHKLTLRCSCVSDRKPSYNWGSLLHGALTSMLPSEIADFFHEEGLRPFSQYVLPADTGSLHWHIGLLSHPASEAIIGALMTVSSIELSHNNSVLTVTSAEKDSINEKDFFRQFFDEDKPCRKYELEFLTPCTHKSSGNYMLFPSVELIIQNLVLRFSEFSEMFSLDFPDAVGQIIDNTHISAYRLRSSKFSLKNAAITGYTGTVAITISGPDQLARLAGMLLSYAEYSGIGIKTSLGMGGCRVRRLKGKN